MAPAGAAYEKAWTSRLPGHGREHVISTPSVSEGVAGHEVAIRRRLRASSPLAIAPSLRVGVLFVREPLGLLAVCPAEVA